MPVGLLNVKALGDDGTGSVNALARGIRWATRRGATAINVSAGVYQPSCRGDCPLCTAALAASDDGIDVFAAAGNEGADRTMCPAKAALTHPQSRVSAAGSLNKTGTSPAVFSGKATSYLPDVIVPAYLLSVSAAGDDPANWGPKHREASAFALLKLAVSRAVDGDTANAMKLFDEVITRCADDPAPGVRAFAARALLNKGKAFLGQRRFAEEVAAYTGVIDRFGGEADDDIRDGVDGARGRRAAARQREGDDAGALADLSAIIDRDLPLTPDATLPDRTRWQQPAWALLHRGELLQALGRPAEADADFAAARRWFSQAAGDGHTNAMTALGHMIMRSEPEAARPLFELAAAGGELDAMFNLGLLLTRSEPATAMAWYEKAAEAGHAPAAYNLAVMVAESDPARAWHWYEVAAGRGHAGAMFNLAAMLMPISPVVGRQWMEKAAAAGDAEAADWLRKAPAGSATEADIDAEGQRLAAVRAAMVSMAVRGLVPRVAAELKPVLRTGCCSAPPPQLNSHACPPDQQRHPQGELACACAQASTVGSVSR
jgi:TPR repeat protein